MSNRITPTSLLLLSRWLSLMDGDGLKRAARLERILFFIGTPLLVAVVLGVVYRLHPAVIALATLVCGWLIAERNALRTRIAQLAVLPRYIDLEPVRKDPGDA